MASKPAAKPAPKPAAKPTGSLNKPTVGGAAAKPTTPGKVTAPGTVDNNNAALLSALNTQKAQQDAATEAAKRNIAAQLTALFQGYGLESLAPSILAMVQDGKGADQISLELQNTDAYKKRFPANDARRKAGLPVLSPAEYISTERAYRQVMSAAGLPVGFYDTHDDFKSFLEKDISPTEIQSRVNAASEAINSAPAGTLDIFKQYYNTGDLIAYALDPSRAEPLIEQRIKAAEAGASAKNQGVQIGQSTAEDLGRQGFTTNQLQQGFGAVAADASTAAKLSQVYGDNVTTDDLVKSTFNSDAAATDKVKKLASKERAAFSGTAGAGFSSLSKNSGGQL